MTNTLNQQLAKEIEKQIKELENSNKLTSIIKQRAVGAVTKVAGAFLIKRGKVTIKKAVIAAVVAETIEGIITYQLNKSRITEGKKIITKLNEEDIMQRSMKTLEQYAEIQINKTTQSA